MKKIATLLLFFSALLGKSAAQDYNKIRFGFQASPTWSWMRTSDKKLDGVSSNWGLKVGVVGEYYFARNYAFMAGLGFGLNQGGAFQNGYQRGIFWPNSDLSETNFDTVSLNTKLRYHVTYVEIPFGLRLRGGSNEDSRIKFYAEIPTFTLGFVSKSLGDISGNSGGNDTVDENIRDDVNGLALSWGLGGGVEYEVATSTTLVAGLAYQHGFTDVTSDKAFVLKDGAFIKEDSKGTIGTITFRIGVFF